MKNWLADWMEIRLAFMDMRLRQLQAMIAERVPDFLIQLQIQQIVAACYGQKGEA